MDLNNKLALTTIQQFYNNSNVFITGATGFLGNILIEKLLRSTNVNSIYILIREKKGINFQKRFDEMFDNTLYQKVKLEVPNYKKKLIPINGDLTMPDLGLKGSDRLLLITKVNIVFHIGATVKMNENLRVAYNINVIGTRNVLEISKKMNNLKSFMHISTAFSNFHRDIISEEIYDCPEDLEMTLLELSDEELDKKTVEIIGKWENTYTFTKAISESLIKKQGNGLPIGIFRAPIVLAIYKDPVPSWINNSYGPTALLAAMLLGINLVHDKCKENIHANVAPVDFCIAAVLAAAWEVGDKNLKKENIKVYNYLPMVQNPITWGEMCDFFYYHANSHPLSNGFFLNPMIFIKNGTIQAKALLFFDILQGVIYDTLSFIMGKRPRFLKIVRSIQKAIPIFHPFSIRQPSFANNNVQNLFSKMSTEDVAIFSFNLKNVNWFEYMKIYAIGVRKFIFKEPDETLEYARRRLKRIRKVNSILKYLLIYFLLEFIWKIISIFYKNYYIIL